MSNKNRPFEFDTQFLNTGWWTEHMISCGFVLISDRYVPTEYEEGDGDHAMMGG